MVAFEIGSPVSPSVITPDRSIVLLERTNAISSMVTSSSIITFSNVCESYP